MSQKQKLVDLRQQLERWRSHNEVHAKPADKMLYDFLSDLLKLGEYEEQPEPPQEIQAESPLATGTTDSAEGDEGGNNPDNPPTLP